MVDVISAVIRFVNQVYNIFLICSTGHYFNYRLYNELIAMQRIARDKLKPEMRESGTSMYDLPIITVESMEDQSRKNSENWINYNRDLLLPFTPHEENSSSGSSATSSSEDLNYNALGQRNSDVSQYYSDQESYIPCLLRRWSVSVDSNLKKLNTSGDTLPNGQLSQTAKKPFTLKNLVEKKLESADSKSTEYRITKEFLQNVCKENGNADQLSDDDIKELIFSKQLSVTRLESVLGNLYRAVKIRREVIDSEVEGRGIYKIPFADYDYSKIFKCCIENCVGYVQMPVGIAGPNLINGKSYRVPMATTEGCLVASTNRGCQAIRLSGGVNAFITGDCMTRGPYVELPSAKRAVDVYRWLTNMDSYQLVKQAFDSTSRIARLVSIKPLVVGRYLFIRFVATTGQAMGMNMVSKGTDKALNLLKEYFPDIIYKCLSGNFCTDKKPSLQNWTEGRGKSVIAEAMISGGIVKTVLKTTVDALVKTNMMKNFIGSSLVGTIGGFNAQAANVVAAMFIATGQDAAHVVGSSNCVTCMESCGKNNEDLYICCTMPSIELGTIGGGTNLTSQSACIELLNLENNSSKELSKVVCGTVMAAELSLMSSLAEGTLMSSHLKLNRGVQTTDNPVLT